MSMIDESPFMCVYIYNYLHYIINRAANHQVCVLVSLNSYFAQYELRDFL